MFEHRGRAWGLRDFDELLPLHRIIVVESGVPSIF
jgi:hypothetical protein